MLVSTNMSKIPSSLKVMPTNSNPKVHAFIIARCGHINQQFFLQLLTSHAMPYTLAHVSLCHSGSPSKAHWIYPLKIQSVPPTYRKNLLKADASLRRFFLTRCYSHVQLNPPSCWAWPSYLTHYKINASIGEAIQTMVLNVGTSFHHITAKAPNWM